MAADHSKRRALHAWALRTVLCAVPTLLASHVALALDKPTGPVMLTVEGNISAPNQGAKAQFDMAMLEKLPQHTFTTQTPWEPKPVKFSGPLLKDVLAAVKASGSQLTAVALNDYKISLPVTDATQFGVMLAYRMNDEVLSVRTKGPLFVIYPFDSQAELKSAKHYERSIWQLKAIDVQ